MKSPIDLPVNSSENLEALDVRIEVDQEIIAKPLFAFFVKMVSLDQVVPGNVENLKPH